MSKLLAIFLFTTIVCQTLPSEAQDFRIETVIYAGEEKKQVAQNITLFKDKMIYDFRLAQESNPKPTEIAVFDQREMTFTLIDVTRGYRTKMGVPQLIKMVEGLRQQVKISSRTKFLIEPLTEKVSPSGNQMDLKSKFIHYQIEGSRPADAEVLPLYYEYLTQFTRLMASDPKSLPPFARIQLNQTIKKMGWLPTRIDAHYKSNQLLRHEIKLQAKHSFLKTLSQKDLERIASAKSLLIRSQPVSLPIYRGLPQQASQSENKRR